MGNGCFCALNPWSDRSCNSRLWVSGNSNNKLNQIPNQQHLTILIRDVEKMLWDSDCQTPCALCIDKDCATSCQVVNKT